MRLLVVDDERRLTRLLCWGPVVQGIAMDLAHGGREGLRLVTVRTGDSHVAAARRRCGRGPVRVSALRRRAGAPSGRRTIRAVCGAVQRPATEEVRP
ncbi:hypothetical protein Q3V23_33745 [Streptomyces sp. VNUA116]|uniref:hypothetical protein n=1 Tax=Streptomyces sp. VNUA116 TaxID=3062449 RepID=UPI00267648C8|nr:hypothetical protein [Streptomyces sp. VNUA116]WKU48643.1 hypothetical protein Q3V23_33745 [Streptomyces sp. VNUA116]